MIHFLGENDFRPAMEGENKAWRKDHVEDGYFRAEDGCRLHYYVAVPPERRGNVVICHGFCEFFGKYHEMAWYFYRAGYGVFFLEMRGHGYSDRALPEGDLVHVDSFHQYTGDVRTFLERIVLPRSSGKDLFLLGHSMGGAIGALFLEEYPSYFKRAVLSSPMLGVRTGKYGKLAVSCLVLHAKVHHMEHDLSVGQHRWDPRRDFSTSSALSEVRFDYLYDQRVADLHYQTSGATFGWVIASLKAGREIIRKAGKVKIPVLIFQAGRDHLVVPKAQEDFAQKAKDTTLIRVPESKHEIFNATEEIRTDWYRKIFSFFGLEEIR